MHIFSAQLYIVRCVSFSKYAFRGFKRYYIQFPEQRR